MRLFWRSGIPYVCSSISAQLWKIVQTPWPHSLWIFYGSHKLTMSWLIPDIVLYLYIIILYKQKVSVSLWHLLPLGGNSFGKSSSCVERKNRWNRQRCLIHNLDQFRLSCVLFKLAIMLVSWFLLYKKGHQFLPLNTFTDVK